MEIQLVPPTESYRESFLRALREFKHEGLPWWVGGDVATAEQDFAAYVAGKLADSERRTETLVPKTHLWAVAAVARAIGLTEVLLTCDETNAASIRVIERNGGLLRETKVLDLNRPLKRYYWIRLS